jgi:hypothetical protein
VEKGTILTACMVHGGFILAQSHIVGGRESKLTPADVCKSLADDHTCRFCGEMWADICEQAPVCAACAKCVCPWCEPK